MYVTTMANFFPCSLIRLSIFKEFSNLDLLIYYFIFAPGVDGWVARRLQQTSRFGAWLDVVIDNIGRGMLWNMLYDVSSDSRGMQVCPKHICISFNDFDLCAC